MEGLRCRSREADHLGMVETVQFEAPTLLIFMKLFDEPMLEISGVVTAVAEEQGGDTRWDKFVWTAIKQSL